MSKVDIDVCHEMENEIIEVWVDGKMVRSCKDYELDVVINAIACRLIHADIHLKYTEIEEEE